MSKIIFIIIALVLLNNCSLNKNSKIWKGSEKKSENNNNILEVFGEERNTITSFNDGLKLDLSGVKTNNVIIENYNNNGSQTYKGELNKIANFKFSKLDEISHLDFKPGFLKNGIIFFDNKGSIIRYDNDKKVIWKKNFYSKKEKKHKPKLSFISDNENLYVVDNIAKYYSINLKTGKLNWSKYNTYPFNSNIKKYKDKIFAIDYKNTLRCYKKKDGSECWNLQTEDSFTISNIKYSLIIVNDQVVFSNSIGDITAVDTETGFISWQLPTQGNDIIKETFNFKISKLVSDGKSIFFSNNKNEFYSIDFKTGTTNWVNEINSNIKPILIENLILTISNTGYLYILEKNTGNIIRISDLYKNYKDKKRNHVYPIGFAIGGKDLFLSNSDGKIIVSSIELGNIIKIEKVSSGLISEPYIYNKNLYVVRNGSIIKYN